MTLGELIGPEGKLSASSACVPIAGLAADSRAVKPGYLFAALPGVKTDGARFIADALQRGAAAILVGEGGAPMTASAAVVEDSDPRRLLALIASRTEAKSAGRKGSTRFPSPVVPSPNRTMVSPATSRWPAAASS